MTEGNTKTLYPPLFQNNWKPKKNYTICATDLQKVKLFKIVHVVKHPLLLRSRPKGIKDERGNLRNTGVFLELVTGNASKF